MRVQSKQNKTAWEYRAYEFWQKRNGTPQELADKLVVNPAAALKKHQGHLKQISGKRIANLCGSNGRKAVPLALLGAEVTVFDISEENKRYALELAACAKTTIDFIVTDVYDIDMGKYGGYFDILYLEGGILHYFHDLRQLMNVLHNLLKDGGQLILGDFHPLGRCLGNKEGNYFDSEPRDGDVAYKSFFPEEEQTLFPPTALRLYTLSDILNAVLRSGFILRQFDEHRGWNNENIPWEFTLLANK